MSFSIRNRASPFKTDQKHEEEMWIVSLISVFVFLITSKIFVRECGEVRGQQRENTAEVLNVAV